MNRYDIGDTVYVTATFTDIDGDLDDPATVTCTFQRPDRSTFEAETTSDSTGVWEAHTDIDMSGTWRYRFYGESEDSAAEEGVFVVRRQRVI